MPTSTTLAFKPHLSNATKFLNAVALVNGGVISILKASNLCDVDRLNVKRSVKVPDYA